MDKYEYKLKLDQMKSLTAENNYKEAAEIADTINWNKVKNVNALVKVGEVFEKAERYQESHDVLLMAYDRSPIGRMIIYRLAEVAIKMKDFVGADVSRLVNEMDKLIMLVGKGGAITPEIIERNIGISKDFNNFELENALVMRNAAKAFRIIDYFTKNPKKNPTVLTVSVLFAFFSTLLLAHTAKDKSERGIMEQIDAKSQYRARIFIDAMSRYSTANCVNIIGAIRDFDCKSKGIGSRQNEYELLKELVAKIIYMR